ncbi:MAG: carboxypeptidase-like regulatory domain-containing protein [Rhizonema sp. PD37]|nr:carboxypeptidase-like regulatory domain-containing protein [Rhizonema sp. PD37]
MSNNPEISFQGRVIDQEKQAPLSGIKVSLDFSGAPPVVYTDLEGIYKFKVNFRDSGIIKGQLTVEAKGYKTYKSGIELSPKHKDLGDIQLGTTSLTSSNHSTTTSNSELITTSANTNKSNTATSNNTKNSTSNYKKNTVNSNNMLMPLMVAVMIAFALIIAALTQPSSQDTPSKIREKRTNLYHQNHTRTLDEPE